MADQHELKQLFEGIETDDAEMARYRSHLAAKLHDESTRGRARSWGWRWAWVGTPLLAGLAAFFVLTAPRVDLQQQSLDQLRVSVAASADPIELRTQAESLRKRGTELERLNANMVLCLTQPNGEALEAAARGAVEDPRPEFRAFYVEYLLDHADSYQLDQEKVELAIDDEDDPVCLELYGHLLKMAKPAPEISPKA